MLDKYKDLMEDCSMCNDQCVYGCPAFTINRTTTVYPGRKVYLARCIIKNEIELDENVQDVLYQCCSCGLCKTFCLYGIKGKPRDPVPLIQEIRHEIIKKGIKSDFVKEAEMRIKEFGNLYGDVSNVLKEVKAINKSGKNEGIIYLVDAEVLALSPEIPKAAIQLMNKKNVKPIISDMLETGYDIKAIGFLDEAASIAKNTADYLNNLSASKLIVSSPKAFYALTEWYKEINIEINKEVILETDFFRNLLIVHHSEYKLRPLDIQNFIKNEGLVVYHDGSFMARYLKKFDTPRMLVKPLFTRFEELRTSREEARPLAPAVYPLGLSEDYLKKLANNRIADIMELKPDYVVTSDSLSYAALKKYWEKDKVLSIPEALLMSFVDMEK